MRQTSIDAFNRAVGSGLVSKARLAVYVYLHHNGPKTSGEIFQALKTEPAGHKLVKGSVCARVRELTIQDLVIDTGETRACGLTGDNATLWDVTANFPKPLERKENARKAKIKAVFGMLDELAAEAAIFLHPQSISKLKEAISQL